MTYAGQLTYAQELLRLTERAMPGYTTSPDYELRQMFRLKPGTRGRALQEALSDVSARHGALRTLIEGDKQTVLPPGPLRLAAYDLSDVDVFTADLAPARWQGPPWLEAHLGFGDKEDALVLRARHSAVDVWSMRVLARDLGYAYAARTGIGLPLTTEVMQYLEIADDDHSPKWQQTITKALPYWEKQLAGIPETTLDPGPRRYAEHQFAIDPQLWHAVEAIARRHRTTALPALLTAYMSALGESVVPVLTVGRISSEWDTVGLLGNILWMRTEMCADLSELCDRVDRTCRDANAHDIPFYRVLDAAPHLENFLRPAFQFIPQSPIRTSVFGDPVHTMAPPIYPVPMLWTLQQDGGVITYDTNIYNHEWVCDKAADFLAAFASLGGV